MRHVVVFLLFSLFSSPSPLVPHVLFLSKIVRIRVSDNGRSDYAINITGVLKRTIYYISSNFGVKFGRPDFMYMTSLNTFLRLVASLVDLTLCI